MYCNPPLFVLLFVTNPEIILKSLLPFIRTKKVSPLVNTKSNFKRYHKFGNSRIIVSRAKFPTYRISANSFRGNYSFLKLGVRKVFKGGNYSREETINLLPFCKHS